MNKEHEIQRINKCITELVYDKVVLKTAYNYYHGVRDPKQYEYLKQQYGISNPIDIEFVPFTSKHVDVLVGEYLDLDQSMEVSVKDDATLSNIMRDKQLAIHKECFDYFQKYLQNSLVSIITGEQQMTTDPTFEKEIQKIRDRVDKNFVSDYTLAAQNILTMIKQSRDIDLKNKLRELFTDLLVGGCIYYDTQLTPGEDGVKLIPLNPLDTFIERNPNEFWLNKSPRAVVRKYMTYAQVMATYGDDLTEEAKNELKDAHYNDYDLGAYEVHNGAPIILTDSQPKQGILAGMEVVPNPYFRDGNLNNESKITVYEVQWLEVDEDDVIQRHEGVRIGSDIFIVKGVNENAPRSVMNPKETTLSINGMFFNDKNGQPFSMILATKAIQDKHDLVTYYRDNLIASSGTVGDWLDAAHLPAFLGETLPERAQAWIAYKKQGIAWFDSSQEGTEVINTTFNGYNDTLKAECIQAFQIALDELESKASMITGVFREKLGGIQQRDAVSNVKVGVRQSTQITRPYFHAMDMIFREVNYDLLNLSKIAFKDGITGELILGPHLKRVFTALPKHYTMTDFDLYLQDSTEVFQAKEQIKQSSVELVKAGAADVDLFTRILLAKNTNQLVEYVDQSVAKKKEENDAITQLQQQLQQYEQQMKQQEQQMQDLQKQLQQKDAQLQKNSEEKLRLEEERVKIEKQKADDTKEYNDRIARNKERLAEIEIMQLNDGNPYNDQIKNY